MAGHMKSPRGPHAARGPRVGQHWPRQLSTAEKNKICSCQTQCPSQETSGSDRLNTP